MEAQFVISDQLFGKEGTTDESYAVGGKGGSGKRGVRGGGIRGKNG